MNWLIVGVVFFMLFLSYVVYKSFFKRILHVRKQILFFSHKLLRLDQLKEEIIKANDEEDYAKSLELCQESIQEFEEQQILLDQSVCSFLSNVTPIHKTYFMISQSLQNSAKEMVTSFDDVIEMSEIDYTYRESVSLLYKLQDDKITTLPQNFIWWRDVEILPFNVGNLILRQEIGLKNSEADFLLLQSNLDEIKHYPESDLPCYEPLAFRENFSLVYVLHNKSIAINMGLRSCIRLIAKTMATFKDAESAAHSYALEQIIQQFIELIRLQRQTWWILGWHKLIPSQQELDVHTGIYTPQEESDATVDYREQDDLNSEAANEHRAVFDTDNLTVSSDNDEIAPAAASSDKNHANPAAPEVQQDKLSDSASADIKEAADLATGSSLDLEHHHHSKSKAHSSQFSA